MTESTTTHEKRKREERRPAILIEENFTTRRDIRALIGETDPVAGWVVLHIWLACRQEPDLKYPLRDLKILQTDLNLDHALLAKIIDASVARGLLSKDVNFIWSEEVLKRVDAYDEKIERKRQAGFASGEARRQKLEHSTNGAHPPTSLNDATTTFIFPKNWTDAAKLSMVKWINHRKKLNTPLDIAAIDQLLSDYESNPKGFIEMVGYSISNALPNLYPDRAVAGNGSKQKNDGPRFANPPRRDKPPDKPPTPEEVALAREGIRKLTEKRTK